MRGAAASEVAVAAVDVLDLLSLDAPLLLSAAGAAAGAATALLDAATGIRLPLFAGASVETGAAADALALGATGTAAGSVAAADLPFLLDLGALAAVTGRSSGTGESVVIRGAKPATLLPARAAAFAAERVRTDGTELTSEAASLSARARLRPLVSGASATAAARDGAAANTGDFCASTADADANSFDTAGVVDFSAAAGVADFAAAAGVAGLAAAGGPGLAIAEGVA